MTDAVPGVRRAPRASARAPGAARPRTRPPAPDRCDGRADTPDARMVARPAPGMGEPARLLVWIAVVLLLGGLRARRHRRRRAYAVAGVGRRATAERQRSVAFVSDRRSTRTRQWPSRMDQRGPPSADDLHEPLVRTTDHLQAQPHAPNARLSGDYFPQPSTSARMIVFRMRRAAARSSTSCGRTPSNAAWGTCIRMPRPSPASFPGLERQLSKAAAARGTEPYQPELSAEAYPRRVVLIGVGSEAEAGVRRSGSAIRTGAA